MSVLNFFLFLCVLGVPALAFSENEEKQEESEKEEPVDINDPATVQAIIDCIWYNY